MSWTKEKVFSRSARVRSVLVAVGSVEDAAFSTGKEFEDPEAVATPAVPGLCAEPSGPLRSST